MAVTDSYVKLKRKSMDRLFTEIFELKAEKKILDDKLKELEAQYKPDLVNLKNDVFYELDNGLKFSIRKSTRKGSISTSKMESFGLVVDDFRGKESDIFTLRLDK